MLQKQIIKDTKLILIITNVIKFTSEIISNFDIIILCQSEK